MKSFAVNLLKPGMVFSKPVYLDESNILVPAGNPVKPKDIFTLQALGIDTVWTDGAPQSLGIEPKGFTAVRVNQVNPTLSLSEVHENKGSYRTYISLIERINTMLLRIASREVIVDNRPVNAISTQLLQAVRDQRELFIGFILGGEVKGYAMAKSSVNTAILSALIAQEIRLPHHKIINIIIGALLHDAGMLRLPREITEKRGELSGAERQRMHSHPLLANNIVTRELNYHNEVGDIVLQHHERWDGNGYPYGFAGERIDKGARIVSITDAFEAMVSQKPYRNSIVGYQAMKNLLADNSRRFDPELLKIFILIMGIYPIGSIVRLNNGVIARVSDTRADAPLRPKIQVLIDEYKKVYKNERGFFIDLLMEKHLYITKAMTVKELSELNV